MNAKSKFSLITLSIFLFTSGAASADEIGTGRPGSDSVWDRMMQPIYELLEPSASTTTATVGDSGDDEIGTGKP